MGWNSYLTVGAVCLLTSAVNGKSDTTRSIPGIWREPWPPTAFDRFAITGEIESEQRSDSPWAADWLRARLSFNGFGSGSLSGSEITYPTPTWGYPGTIRADFDIKINATGSETVLNLTDFVLTGGTLTLEGTAAQSFVINVSRQFSLSGDASIVLSGGILPENVTFNILGTGKDVVLRQHASLVGNLVAPERRVVLRGYSTVLGTVDAESVRLKGVAQIVPPPVVSP